MAAPDEPRVTRATRDAEAEEARTSHDVGPIDEDAATRAPDRVDEEVRASEREMNERGAQQRGEGRLP